jgi:hypothetical protein
MLRPSTATKNQPRLSSTSPRSATSTQLMRLEMRCVMGVCFIAVLIKRAVDG